MAQRRPATVLREAFGPGDPVSLDEAAAILHHDRERASKALTYLASSGYYEKVRQRLWVRTGASPNPYRLGARVTSPYAFAYGTALALHGAAASQRSEVLVSSPRRFEAFEYDGVHYRRALPWPEGALVKVSVGPEFVWTTSTERTLVDCVRVPANAGGMAELLRSVSALPRLDGEELLRWVDHYGEATLAARLGFVLESSALTDRDAKLFQELERRRPQARVYLEPGRRGGRLLQRWNLIVPRHLLFSLGEETRSEP
jgi:predicted transcriptional regulator of viral defense system